MYGGTQRSVRWYTADIVHGGAKAESTGRCAKAESTGRCAKRKYAHEKTR